MGECPLPPPARVLEAARQAVVETHRYPAPGLRGEVEELYSRYAGVPRESVVVVPGSDTVLEIISWALTPGSASTLWPGFYSYTGLLQAYFREHYIHRIGEPRDPLLSKRDLETMASQARLVVVEDPNNPLGHRSLPGPREALASLGPGNLLLVDEAYYEFSGRTLARMVEAEERLLVARTMSKAFGLAGMRVGFIIAHPRVAERIRSWDPLPFRVPAPSLAAAREALRDPEYSLGCAELMARWRDWLAHRLAREGLRVYWGDTPYLLVETGVPGAAGRLREAGVLVSDASWWRPGAIRVTPAATPGENRVILEAILGLASQVPR